MVDDVVEVVNEIGYMMLTFGGGVVPADLCEGADEGELGHVGGGAVAVVVVVPPFAALVLVPAAGISDYGIKLRVLVKSVLTTYSLPSKDLSYHIED